jgi:hypothetical protein
MTQPGIIDAYLSEAAIVRWDRERKAAGKLPMPEMQRRARRAINIKARNKARQARADAKRAIPESIAP